MAATVIAGAQIFGVAPASAEAPAACAYLSQAAAGPDGPLFLASYPNEKSGPLQDAAFLYDNAAAAIALVACGDARRGALRAWHRRPETVTG